MTLRLRRVLWASLLAFVLATGLVVSDWPARWLLIADDGLSADAAVVLAGDRDYERTITASALVRSGRVRLLIVTGGAPGPGDGAASLRDEALRHGVPADRIRMETASHSTRESLVAVRRILREEDVRRVVLVTSPYHQRRTLLCARRALPGIAFSSRAASPSFWSPRRWWRTRDSVRIVLTEYAKLVYYVCRGWV